MLRRSKNNGNQFKLYAVNSLSKSVDSYPGVQRLIAALRTEGKLENESPVMIESNRQVGSHECGLYVVRALDILIRGWGHKWENVKSLEDFRGTKLKPEDVPEVMNRFLGSVLSYAGAPNSTGRSQRTDPPGSRSSWIQAPRRRSSIAG